MKIYRYLKHLILFLLISCFGCTLVAVETAKVAIDKRTFQEQRKDADLANKIKMELVKEKGINSSAISVIAFLGRVYLTGIVSDTDQATRVFQACKKMGVSESDIVSNLVIDEIISGGQRADSWLTTKVKTAFLKDEELSGINIHVATVNGMVVLVGLVDTEAQWKRAGKVAAQAGGKPVKNYVLLLKR